MRTHHRAPEVALFFIAEGGKVRMQNFTVTCYQNEYLPQDACDVNAVITVSAEGAAGGWQRDAGGGAASTDSRGEAESSVSGNSC